MSASSPSRGRCAHPGEARRVASTMPSGGRRQCPGELDRRGSPAGANDETPSLALSRALVFLRHRVLGGLIGIEAVPPGGHSHQAVEEVVVGGAVSLRGGKEARVALY